MCTCKLQLVKWRAKAQEARGRGRGKAVGPFSSSHHLSYAHLVILVVIIIIPSATSHTVRCLCNTYTPFRYIGSKWILVQHHLLLGQARSAYGASPFSLLIIMTYFTLGMTRTSLSETESGRSAIYRYNHKKGFKRSRPYKEKFENSTTYLEKGSSHHCWHWSNRVPIWRAKTWKGVRQESEALDLILLLHSWKWWKARFTDQYYVLP